MKPYPRNNIDYVIPTPEYTNQSINMNSRYSIYRIITNLPFNVLEVKLRNLITTNKSFRKLTVVEPQTTVIIPALTELTNTNGYFLSNS